MQGNKKDKIYQILTDVMVTFKMVDTTYQNMFSQNKTYTPEAFS